MNKNTIFYYYFVFAQLKVNFTQFTNSFFYWILFFETQLNFDGIITGKFN